MNYIATQKYFVWKSIYLLCRQDQGKLTIIFNSVVFFFHFIIQQYVKFIILISQARTVEHQLSVKWYSFCRLFTYMFWRWISSCQEERIVIPSTGLSLPLFWACPNPGHGYLTSYVMVFFYVLWFEMSLSVLLILVELLTILF